MQSTNKGGDPMSTQLEHANMAVENMSRMLEFLQNAFPDWSVRHDSGKEDPERWLHFGNDDFYLAVYQATVKDGSRKIPYDGNPGINHLGFVVEDAQQLRHRLLDAGFKETTLENEHPARKRVYFNDAEGNDWEFVQYFTENPGQRNDYLHDMASGLIDRI
jgi:catechol 2,3-dioxygenase-like lactoylglutathione lyase family enzyme